MKYLEELFNLEGRGALVIGGSGVLGGALALALANAGARVAVGYSKNREGAEKVAAAITAAGGSARAVRVDATS